MRLGLVCEIPFLVYGLLIEVHHKLLNFIWQLPHLLFGNDYIPFHPWSQLLFGAELLYQVGNISLDIINTLCLTCHQAQPILQKCKLFLKFLSVLSLGGNLPLHFMHPPNAYTFQRTDWKIRRFSTMLIYAWIHISITFPYCIWILKAIFHAYHSFSASLHHGIECSRNNNTRSQVITNNCSLW